MRRLSSNRTVVQTPTKYNMLTGTESDEEEDGSGEDCENSQEDEASLRALETLWEAKMPTQWKMKIQEDPSLQTLLCKVWAESLSHFFKAPDVSHLSTYSRLSVDLSAISRNFRRTYGEAPSRPYSRCAKSQREFGNKQAGMTL